jgi:hypothetical protein
LNLPSEIIKKRLPEWKVEHLDVRNKQNYLEFNKEALIFLYTKNRWSLAKTAQFFGIKPSYLFRKLKAWHVPVRHEEHTRRPRIGQKWLINRGFLSKQVIKTMSFAQRRQYVEHHKEVIFHMYEKSGIPLNTIAEQIGISINTLRDHLRSWGVHIRSRSPREETLLIEANKSNIIKWYRDENKTAQQIADILGLAECTILLRLKKWNIAARDYRKADPVRVRQLWDEGYRASQIAHMCGCDTVCVYRALGVKTARKNYIDEDMKGSISDWYQRRGMSVHDITTALNRQINARADINPGVKRRIQVTPTMVYNTISAGRMKKFKLPFEEWEKKEPGLAWAITDYAKKGLSQKAIVLSLHTNNDFVAYVLRTYGARDVLNVTRKPEVDQVVNKIRALAENGRSANYISHVLRIPETTVYKLMSRHGIKPGSKVGRYSEIQMQGQAIQISELRKQVGMTLEKISKITKLPIVQVSRIIQMYDIPAPERTYSEEQYSQVRSLHSQGLGTSEIAAAVNVKKKQAEYIQLRLGLRPNPTKPAYSQAAIDLQNAYLKKYYNGPYFFSATYLARKLDLDKSTVLARLQQMGIEIRDNTEQKQIRHLRSLGKLSSGFNIPENDLIVLRGTRPLKNLAERRYYTWRPR